VLVRELLKGGLLHEDVNTVAGFGLSRYTMEPWLNNGELDWREGATAPLTIRLLRLSTSHSLAMAGRKC
jgi:phosphogluconate dehydratase